MIDAKSLLLRPTLRMDGRKASIKIQIDSLLLLWTLMHLMSFRCRKRQEWQFTFSHPIYWPFVWLQCEKFAMDAGRGLEGCNQKRRWVSATQKMLYLPAPPFILVCVARNYLPHRQYVESCFSYPIQSTRPSFQGKSSQGSWISFQECFKIENSTDVCFWILLRIYPSIQMAVFSKQRRRKSVCFFISVIQFLDLSMFTRPVSFLCRTTTCFWRAANPSQRL